MEEQLHDEDLSLGAEEAQSVSGGMQVPNPGPSDLVRAAVNSVVHASGGAPAKSVGLTAHAPVHPGPFRRA